MGRKEFIFLTTNLLVLGAGVVLGRLSVRPHETVAVVVSPSTTDTRPSNDDWLTRQLKLSSVQSAEMIEIWSDTNQKNRNLTEQRRDLESDREQDVLSLMDFATALRYEKILEDYRNANHDLDRQRAQLVKSANDRVRSILNDEQRKKFDALLEENPRGRGGPPGPPGGRRGGAR